MSDPTIQQGSVLWAADPFKQATDTERPLVVLSNDDHPFAGEQWIAVALSTTPRSRAIELTEEAWTDGTLPQRSYAYPWAVVSPRIEHIEFVVGAVRSSFVAELTSEVTEYIEVP